MFFHHQWFISSQKEFSCEKLNFQACFVLNQLYVLNQNVLFQFVYLNKIRADP